MGKKSFRLHKSFQVYLSKLKKVPSFHQKSSPGPAMAAGAATPTGWLLSACKYPKTPSFALDRRHPPEEDYPHDQAATLSDVDRFLHENFNSLYASRDHADDDDDDYFSSESPRYDSDTPPAAIRPSERFFVSPGTSSSLLGEARPSETSSPSSPSSPSSSPLSTDAGKDMRDEGVAVMTFSKDPYDDFRRSMQEMVDARHLSPEEPLDWDFMEELLFCYLELNDRSVHKFILRAFTDITIDLRCRFPPARRTAPRGSGKVAISRRTRTRKEISGDRAAPP